MQEDAWWNQECRWLKGTRHQAALAQGSDLAGEKKELLADFEEKAESYGWTGNGESSW